MLFSNASYGQLRAFKVSVAMFLALFISSSSLVIAQSADKAIAADAGMVVSKLWEDLNRDGVQDLNEPGVSGVMVGLFSCDGAFIESRMSNDVGVIPFVASAGCYQLRYADIQGYRYCPSGLTGDVANDSDVNPSTRTSAPFEITAGSYQINVDAGVMQIQNSEIGDRVWHDLNANGVQDFNEPGLGNVPVSLLNCNGQAIRDLDGQAVTAASDEQGNFLFENLSNGCYIIETQLEDGHYLTDDHASTPQYDSDLNPVTLRSDVIQLQSSQGLHNIDVGVYQHGSIGDYVWLDANRNGVQENGESGMSGVSVLLLDQNGSPTGRTATTDSHGRYEFAELKPGQYRLQFVIPEDYVAAQKDQGESDLLDNDGNSLGATAGFTVLSAQTQTDIDFGVVQQQVIEIALEARTYGDDADSPKGPFIAVGDSVSWEYIVTNTGDLPLFNIFVEDDQGVFVTCPGSTLEAGESLTCTASAGDAQAGQYTNLASVQSTDNPESNSLFTAQDRSHYFGADPSITLMILANGVDANAPGDLTVQAGETVIWEYIVGNTGNVPLENIAVTDSNPDVQVNCPSTTIESGVEMTCTAAGVAQAGENSNTGTVSGEVPKEDPIVVTATDTSFYFGSPSDLGLALLTNGTEVDAPPGPMIPVGDTVTWSYVLTNNGAAIISDAVVTDSQGANVTCPIQILAPGQSITCTATGTAEEGQFSNSATWIGTIDGKITPRSNVAEGYYFGTSPMASVNFNVRTNGSDADTPDVAPQLAVGEPVTWTYVVENSGNVALSDIVIVDDQIGTITCGQTTVEPGETLVCSASSTVEPGAYSNLGTLTAQTPDGQPVMATDPSNYFGFQALIDIELFTNDQDSDAAPGETIPVGEDVEWRYVVTNTGNVDLFGFTVTDSVLGNITCPAIDLLVGESVECVANGTATAGQYANTGTACAPQNEEFICDEDLSHYFGGASALTIQTRTNGADADTQSTAPQINVGELVTWTYNVTNTGTLLLTDVIVTDDQIGTVSCPSTSIEPGETLICTASGSAEAGPYTNLGSVTANDPQGTALDGSDPSNYFGVLFVLSIETLTNGVDADTPPGPIVPLGEPVEWTYVVTNSGNVSWFGFTVTDSVLGDISCPVVDLAPGESTTCTASGISVEGQYANVGTVCVPQNEKLLCAEDPSHYLGGVSGITIQTRTNGSDADTQAIAPQIPVGDTVTWTYNVTNTGNTLLTNVMVTDDLLGPITCPVTEIAAGETIVCTATGTAEPGPYTNIGTVVGTDPQGATLDATDPTNYFGVVASISIETLTNTIDADTPPGPTVPVGGDVTWTYIVTNNGNVDLFGFEVSDTILGPITCPAVDIAVGESIECFATGTATPGQYANVGSVCVPQGEELLCDEDPTHHFGGMGALEIQKLTNGIDVDSAPGVALTVGEAITWTYIVTNSGDLPMTGLSVSDDQGVVVTCPVDSLEPGESTTCSGTGVATVGQYVNVGTACGLSGGAEVCNSDSSFYFASSPSVAIEKLTNSVDADAAPGPVINAGDPVSWTYIVTNTSSITIGAIVVSDDQGVVVTCPMDTLTAGESMTCTGSGTATAGQYANIGSVTSQGLDANGDPVGEPVSASDPSHYFGASSGVSIEKFTNGVDATAAPGPSIGVGETVEWTYVVTNLGNITLDGITVTDDQGVIVTCPLDALAAGQSMTCTGSGTATAGQYTNLGTVNGQGVDGNGEPVGVPQTDSDPSFYFGANSGVSIEKFTNGVDATAAPGPTIAAGDAVEWTYVVTNLGNISLTGVNVTDDQGVTVTCPMDTLTAGESMTCTGSGTATEGQYMNLGSVTGQGVDDNGDPVGEPQTDNDPSFYFGASAGVSIEKFTNGVDATAAPGPSIGVGEAVEWTYVVTNLGNVALEGVSVTDDQGVTVTCPMDALAAGESMTCTGSGTATAGQYMNLGTVTGQGVDGSGEPVGGPQTDTDPSFYFGADSGINIEKFTNGVDVTAAPGPFVPLGSAVEWTYVVTNPGNIALTNVVVTDDQGVTVSCPMDTLAAGESMTCTASGFATAGQYVNVGSVSGQGVDDNGNPVGAPQTDADNSYYFGGVSKVNFEKYTNGQDADAPTGPELIVGDAVEWTYEIFNDGNVTITDLAVSDDQGVVVTCPLDTLAPGESMTCVGNGIATAGQYANIGTLSGQGVDDNGNPFGLDVTASDPSHYFGVTSGIGIEKFTNGVDASAAPGPSIAVGGAVEWTYVVTNLGSVALTSVSVSDDQGVSVTCPMSTLAAGESMTCTGSGTATAGQYMNLGTATGQGVDGDGNPIGEPQSDSDPSFYFGASSGISIEKFTNGVDASAAPGPSIAVGDAVEWTYVVSNLGNIALTGVLVSDDQGVSVTCPMNTLAAGESMTCTGSGTATAGQYMNLGTASGQGVDGDGNPVGGPQTDSDPSFYFGASSGISVEKFTNGVDASAAPGPSIAVGDAVEWTYVVTNLGNIALTNVTVSDDQGVSVSCPMDTLAAGESMTCTGSGTATAGQYMNLGTATGQGVDGNGNPVGGPQTDSDPSFYFGANSGISIEKFTNGVDASAAPGPSIAVGNAVEWTYVVTNSGNISLTGVGVTDDQGVTVSCPMDTLAAGESMTCSGSGTATAGQYMNLGTATGQGIDGDGNPVGGPQTDSDPSFYFGASSGISIEKFTNGVDAAAAPGPSIATGDAVEWTYVVTNLGNISLTGVNVVDDQGVSVTCPMATLAAGESMTCTGSGIATSGQYMNLGTATGQGVDSDGNPVGDPQTDSDPSFYFGGTSAIGIEKFTNGVDVTQAPGPYIGLGNTVEWTYVVTNLGNVTLASVGVTDDQGVVVSCPMDTLAAGESMTCTGSGSATAGQYMNIGSVSGQGVDDNGNPLGEPQTDSDVSFYFGGVTKLTFEKYTNGQDADEPTGPELTVGDAVEWTYVVLNDGNVTISNVNVTDDQGVVVTCPTDTLAPGETMTCVGNGIATLGQYANVGMVTAQGVDNNGVPFGPDLSAVDPSHYLGLALPLAAIGDVVFEDIDRDGVQDANEPGIPGVVVNLWTDDDGDGLPDTQIATTTTGPDGEYLFTDLDPNLVYVVQFVTAPGQQITVQQQGGDPASDSNPDAATGITGPITLNPGQTDPTIDAGIFFLKGSVSIEKTTNGEDADFAPGPDVSVGAAVLWEYTITNTGETTLTAINVSDDRGVAVTCPATELAPGASFVCTGEGIATAGQYKNIGSVNAQPVDGGQPFGNTVSDVDASHYFGVESCMPGFVLDQFNHVSYSNNDGDMQWAGPWTEHDPQGGGASNGNVMVDNGMLILNDYPNSHTEPSASRQVNLDGYPSAMLMFNWSTSQEVGPEDTAVVEISSDGGLSYTVLKTFTNMHGANSGTESFDISAFISSQTVVRFRIAEKFGANWDKFMVDNVRIDKKCENTQICVATSSAGHSFWMSGFNNSGDTDRFNLEPGAQFEQFDDGTATLTGTIVDDARPDRRFDVNMSFAGRTLDPPVGSPKNGFNADPTGWEYYPTWTGSWTGLDDYEGVEIDLSRRGPAMQVGIGANDRPDEQDIYGASAWYDWTVESQANACSHTPGLCIEHSGIGDLNIRLDCSAGGPVACTSSVNETHKHAFYLPNFNGDGVLDRYDLEDGAQFVRNADGTANLTGVIFKQGESSYRFAIDVALSGGTDVPPPGSPYNPQNANPADWFYYPNWSGDLEGLSWNAGANLSIDRRGASFQIGTGANAHSGENDIYGGSGWFDWVTNSQPHDCSYYGDCIKHEGNGDINVQIEQCPQ